MVLSGNTFSAVQPHVDDRSGHHRSVRGLQHRFEQSQIANSVDADT
jgi:hypothetical protein